MTAAMLTPAEVAERLGCSRELVLRELKRKNLRGSLLPHGWRINEDDLKTYIEARLNVSQVRGAR